MTASSTDGARENARGVVPCQRLNARKNAVGSEYPSKYVTFANRERRVGQVGFGGLLPGVVSLLVSLVSGVAGGNATGAAVKDNGLGSVANSLAGLVGGGLGGALLPGLLGMVANSGGPGGIDLSALLASVASGAGGGAVLTIAAALLKNAIASRA